jgi:hypothetical protein
LFIAFAPSASWARGVLLLLQAATFLVALWTSRSDPLGARIVVVIVAVAAAIAEIIFGSKATTTAVGALSGLAVIGTIVVVARGVVDQGEVNSQSVIGAVSIFVLIGLLFTFLYSVDAALASSPFFAQGTDGTNAIRLYFSFVTLTTVGYGDYSPAGAVGHTLANVEALLGQLYLVTVIALLVGRMSRRG